MRPNTIRRQQITSHPAYNASLQSAAAQAYRAGLIELHKWEDGDKSDTFSPPCVIVYIDDSGDKMYVREAKEGAPPRAEMVCLAQYFSRRTVQLRYNGGHSEFVDY